MNLETSLRKRLKAAKKIAVLGVGSELKGDDAAGMIVAQQIKKKKNVKVFLGSSAPENITGEIKKFSPSHLLIIDSAIMQEKEGAIKIFPAQDIAGISFSTHRMPIRILADYLAASIGCDVTFIGIQPQQTEFLSPPGEAVAKSIKRLSGILTDILEEGA
ncbi:MAG: hydrogenase 3 maturation endopeptidase HyCI [Candidatus Omnitrophica bacterium]|nr:hydrogenase 3 maturation endopeptidase HyCI [Candidatus Omnitrophota bacterium]MDD5653670.1 hydrogenase 3 maturation endopeptidase HyCI [Candidatus Omnitrophota bacterium]